MLSVSGEVCFWIIMKVQKSTLRKLQCKNAPKIEYLPDALSNDCKKCSEVQKRQGGRVLSHILEYYRDDWDELVALYDPEGKFREKYAYNIDEDDDGDEAKRK
ncbi:hypothetical protein FQA39_LY10783 [Lamprigera yunnana]|nr:hypothetical protein FQA39_LY10783 [Lamprigera yunnana]